MSLPWFAFNVDKYLGNTLALDAEGHGAYLLLMLHYYRTGEPPRDNDRTLATIARIPLDRWLERRPDIEPFFEIKDGKWDHNVVRDELRDGQRRYDQTLAATAAAKAARQAKKTGTSPSRTSERSTSRTPTRLTVIDTSDVTVSVTDSVANNVTSTQEQEQLQPLRGEEGAPPKPASQGLGSPLDPNFKPSDEAVAIALEHGLTQEDIATEHRKFMARYRDSNGDDWDRSFGKWIEREIAYRAKQKPKAAPRVELNSAPDWDSYAKRFAGGMGWPRGVGGEPGTASCRCPPEILTKHGIDPATGLKVKEQA